MFIQRNNLYVDVRPSDQQEERQEPQADPTSQNPFCVYLFCSTSQLDAGLSRTSLCVPLIHILTWLVVFILLSYEPSPVHHRPSFVNDGIIDRKL